MNHPLTIENTAIEMADSSDKIRLCFKVMRQLRPHFVEEEVFVQQVERQIRGGYRLAFLKDEDEIKAVTGFRFMEFLAYGKLLYIDDLVTDGEGRKKGYASRLLKWLIEQAQGVGCDQVHLDSGPQRHDAHRLYLNTGFKIIGHHFSLDLKSMK